MNHKYIIGTCFNCGKILTIYNIKYNKVHIGYYDNDLCDNCYNNIFGID